MDAKQKNEIGLRAEILGLLVKTYSHSELMPKIRKLKKMKSYPIALSLIHEIEWKMRIKKHEAFRKKLRKKFGRAKLIKRKKR